MATVANLNQAQKPVIAEDDGVREAHGCYIGEEPVVLLGERGNRIVFVKTYGDKLITPKQARYLASKLYRLARRIERREVGQ